MLARTAVIPQMIKLTNDRAMRFFEMGRLTMHLIYVAGQFPLRVVYIYMFGQALIMTHRHEPTHKSS